jgi:hypothetical protein
MSADRKLLLVLALPAAALLSPVALGYTLLGSDWSWQAIPMEDPMFINVSGFPNRVGTREQVTNALIDGMEVWAAEAPADFSFRYGGTTSRTSWTADADFISQWSNTNPGGATLAITQTWFWGNDITECDQRYYNNNGGGQINWSADPNGASANEIDLEAVAVHEYGHCAGLNHSNNNRAIMYAFATNGEGPADRHLHADDMNGIQAMYGNVPQQTTVELDLGDMVIAGQSHTYTITGARAGETVHLLYSTNGTGDGPCPPVIAASGVCMGVMNPILVLATGVANNAGTATIVASLPQNLGGTYVGFQVGVLRGVNNRDTVASHNVRARVLPSNTSCAVGQIPDCSGVCVNSSYLGDGTCDDNRSSGRGSPDLHCEVYHFDWDDCAP